MAPPNPHQGSEGGKWPNLAYGSSSILGHPPSPSCFGNSTVLGSTRAQERGVLKPHP